jgi:hypothetical protein
MTDSEQLWIPVLSLAVAFLSVLIGPLVTFWVTKRQIQSAQQIASMQVISPMRQAWLNTLRQKLAELTGNSLHYFQAGYEDRTDTEYRAMTLLAQEVELMLNPSEEDPRQLIDLIWKMLHSINSRDLDEYPDNHKAVIALSRRILKAEWEATKSAEQ